MFEWLKKKPISSVKKESSVPTVNPFSLLRPLLEKAFGMAGAQVPLGFPITRIAATLVKGPHTGLLRPELQSLLETTWPCESFHVGAMELFGPNQINQEHDDLLPGCVIIKLGLIGFAGNGTGALFAQSFDDGRVYLIPAEYVAEDAIYAPPWERMDLSIENAKKIAEQSWPSLGALFEWAFVELEKLAENNK